MKMRKILAAVSAAVMTFSALSVSVSADWDTADGKQVYYSESGKKVTGYQTIDGKKYYFDKNGYLKTGWVKTSDGKEYYYTLENGRVTGWLKMSNGAKYYMGDDGAMVKGWQVIGDDTYYFAKDGRMKTGWLDAAGGTRYFLNSDGTLARDIALKINGVTYDFDKNGKATARKAGSSSSSGSSAGKDTSTYTTNTTPGEFDTPVGGDKKSSVLKNCGIANVVDLGDNDYGGKVIFGGIKSDIILNFNSKDELYAYALYIPMSYSKYTEVIKLFKKHFGYDYDYEDGSYMWIYATYGQSISYESSYSSAVYNVLFYNYNEK